MIVRSFWIAWRRWRDRCRADHEASIAALLGRGNYPPVPPPPPPPPPPPTPPGVRAYTAPPKNPLPPWRRWRGQRVEAEGRQIADEIARHMAAWTPLRTGVERTYRFTLGRHWRVNTEIEDAQNPPDPWGNT